MGLNFPASGAVGSCKQRQYWETSPWQHHFQWIKADSHVLHRTHSAPTEAALGAPLGREARAGSQAGGWADPATELRPISVILLISSRLSPSQG